MAANNFGEIHGLEAGQNDLNSITLALALKIDLKFV